MKNILKGLLLAFTLILGSCQGLVEDIDVDPNGITISDVDPQLFLTGALLGNTLAQAGHANRIVGMWSGQLTGFAAVYGNAYGYNISTAEANSTWRRVYISVIPQVRHIIANKPNDALLQGISKVIEAHAVGTAASLCGDVPYSEVNLIDIDDPKFDGQISVMEAASIKLDEAISNLSSASSRAIAEDIFYRGDASKWIEAAYTLKARYAMHRKDYAGALAAAQNGISSAANTMKYSPVGSDGTIGDKNLFFEIIAGSRAGDIGSRESYLSKLINPSASEYRGNAKTDETARSAYYTIDDNIANNNQGIINQFEPQQLVSYEENQLILAEAGARTSGFDAGLQRLNEFRTWLNEGGRINDNFSDLAFTYEAYDAADFDAGGIENVDGIDPLRALIREIVEERYVSGFGQFMPFDDARRLRSSDSDVIVPFPLNTATASGHPERFPYADDELNANSNAPGEDPGIFTKTPVNQ
ncbi:MAG: hypothetical protein ACI9FN_000482 [Saprospiraceae bacterium]|jgi:hypothetical protein